MKSSILVSSAGAKIPLINLVKEAAIRTSRNPKVIVGDTNPNSLCKHFSDEFWVMKPLESYEDDELISELIKREIIFVIPTRDGELQRWAQLRSKLRELGIEVLVSTEKTLALTMDKLVFSEWLKVNAFESIETLSLPNFGKNKKIVIKERYASAPKNTIIGVDQQNAKALAQLHSAPIFQEFIEGKEFSVDVWIHASGKSSCLARSRDVIVDGESRVTSIFQNTDLEKLAMNLARKLGVEGPSVFQFIQNPEEKFIPVECNARIGGASTFSISTKFDSLYVSLCEFFDEPLSGLNQPTNYSQQVRVMKDFYF
jgi:carbamoyl-phosphate synthase large subunit